MNALAWLHLINASRPKRDRSWYRVHTSRGCTLWYNTRYHVWKAAVQLLVYAIQVGCSEEGKHQNYSNPSCNPISLQCTPGKSYFPVGWFGDFSGKKGDDSSKVASASAAGAAKAKPSLRRRRPRSRSRMKLPMRSLDDDISKRFTLEKSTQHFYFLTLWPMPNAA